MSDTVQARVRQAVVALKQGKLIILTDDQNREHEGDLVGLASFVTPEKINQALAIARGVLAVPMTAERAAALGLAQMASIILIAQQGCLPLSGPIQFNNSQI